MTQDTQSQASTSGRRGRAKVLAVAFLAGVLAVGGTVAYTTTQVEAENVITFGSVKMRVVQSEPGEDGQFEELDPSDYSITAPMGQLERRLSVQNLGSEPAFVRVKLDMVVEKPNEDPEDATEYRKYGLNLIDPETGTGEGATQGFTVGWSEGADGWYYYNAPISADQYTEPLVTSIELINDFNTYAGEYGTYVFSAEGQAVQSEHNNATALTALGWPEDDEADGQAENQTGTESTDTESTTNDEGQE